MKGVARVILYVAYKQSHGVACGTIVGLEKHKAVSCMAQVLGDVFAGDGVTFVVGVHYEASSPRRISLRFQEAGFSDVRITPFTESVIAPAILPRNWIQQQILLAIKEVSLVPVQCSKADQP